MWLGVSDAIAHSREGTASIRRQSGLPVAGLSTTPFCSPALGDPSADHPKTEYRQCCSAGEIWGFRQNFDLIWGFESASFRNRFANS